jgi:hypothetical protein
MGCAPLVFTPAVYLIYIYITFKAEPMTIENYLADGNVTYAFEIVGIEDSKRDDDSCLILELAHKTPPPGVSDPTRAVIYVTNEAVLKGFCLGAKGIGRFALVPLNAQSHINDIAYRIDTTKEKAFIRVSEKGNFIDHCSLLWEQILNSVIDYYSKSASKWRSECKGEVAPFKNLYSCFRSILNGLEVESLAPVETAMLSRWLSAVESCSPASDMETMRQLVYIYYRTAKNYGDLNSQLICASRSSEILYLYQNKYSNEYMDGRDYIGPEGISLSHSAFLPSADIAAIGWSQVSTEKPVPDWYKRAREGLPYVYTYSLDTYLILMLRVNVYDRNGNHTPLELPYGTFPQLSGGSGSNDSIASDAIRALFVYHGVRIIEHMRQSLIEGNVLCISTTRFSVEGLQLSTKSFLGVRQRLIKWHELYIDQSEDKVYLYTKSKRKLAVYDKLNDANAVLLDGLMRTLKAGQ